MGALLTEKPQQKILIVIHTEHYYSGYALTRS
jgi:hypothetical protein